jgi:hypothetical protein
MAAIGAEEFNFLVAELLIMTIEFALALRTGHPKNFGHGVFPPQRNQIRNPNIEIRNKLEVK